MKFSCEKALLQNAISVTSRAVAQKSSIPALEGLLLHGGEEGLTVSGYNMQTGIRAKVSAGVEEAGEIVLNARLFGDIIRRMPDDMITFSADERQMVHLRVCTLNKKIRSQGALLVRGVCLLSPNFDRTGKKNQQGESQAKEISLFDFFHRITSFLLALLLKGCIYHIACWYQKGFKVVSKLHHLQFFCSG